MIIPDGSPKSPLKGSFSSPKAVSREELENANEVQSSSAHAPPLPPPAYSSSTYAQAVIVHHEAAGWRFLKAFAVAFSIWFLFTILVQIMVELATRNHRHGRIGSGPDAWPLLPSQVELVECIQGPAWTDQGHDRPFPEYPHFVETSFELPISSDLLFFLARGRLSTGVITIVSSPDVRDVATVDVSLYYYREEIRDKARACLIKRHNGENGIGIFTPNFGMPISRQDNLKFELTVHLPASSSSDSPLSVKNLETDLPLFAHSLGDLSDKVNFHSLSLKTSNSPILVKTLYADNVALKTSNAPIGGVFNTSTSLSLVTSNAPIIVDVGLNNGGSQETTELVMKTSNGPIQSTLSLFSTAPDSDGGNFKVSARASNNALNIGFVTSPVESTLNLDARTSNGPALITLHPAYEGVFSMYTSNFSPILERRGAEDPAGRNRTRKVEFNSSKGVGKGRVQWTGSGKHAPGSVQVSSSNAIVHLKL